MFANNFAIASHKLNNQRDAYILQSRYDSESIRAGTTFTVVQPKLRLNNISFQSTTSQQSNLGKEIHEIKNLIITNNLNNNSNQQNSNNQLNYTKQLNNKSGVTNNQNTSFNKQAKNSIYLNDEKIAQLNETGKIKNLQVTFTNNQQQHKVEEQNVANQMLLSQQHSPIQQTNTQSVQCQKVNNFNEQMTLCQQEQQLLRSRQVFPQIEEIIQLQIDFGRLLILNNSRESFLNCYRYFYQSANNVQQIFNSLQFYNYMSKFFQLSNSGIFENKLQSLKYQIKQNFTTQIFTSILQYLSINTIFIEDTQFLKSFKQQDNYQKNLCQLFDSTILNVKVTHKYKETQINESIQLLWLVFCILASLQNCTVFKHDFLEGTLKQFKETYNAKINIQQSDNLLAYVLLPQWNSSERTIPCYVKMRKNK